MCAVSGERHALRSLFRLGKPVQSATAIAVRSPPTNTTASIEATSNEPPTAESLGWQLRAALPPMRLHSVSLYDDQANVLWLSEGALGPDEHSAVMGAFEELTSDFSRPAYEHSLEDGRVGLFIPVRAPQGALVGMAMILADIKSVGEGTADRLVTPQVRTILQKVAVLLRPPSSRGTRTDTTSEIGLMPAGLVPPTLAAAANSARAGAEVAGATGDFPGNDSVEASAEVSELSPQAVDDILEFELTPEVPAAQPAPPLVTVAPPVPRAPRPVAPVAPPVASAPPPLASAPQAVASVPPAVASAPPAVASASAPVASAPPPAAAAAVAPPAAKPSTGATTRTNTLSASSTSNPKVMPSSAATSTTTKALSGVATTTSRVLTLPEGVTLNLELQPYHKLRPGGRTRRFEVLASAMVRETQKITSGLDSFALQRLLSWMGANRAAWNSEPTSFTLNLSIATLEDDRFPQFVASNLKSHSIAPENIGFEIAEALCVQRRAQVERFITLCDKLGCFVVIDDFSMDSAVVPLLRSKALRLVKIDPKLTAVALRDKLAQAMVVAIAQAAKVLGIHCAAKGVDSQATQQWLSAVGCDFAQSPALSPRQPLEALGRPQPAKPSAD